MEVLSPDWFRRELFETVKRMNSLYSDLEKIVVPLQSIVQENETI